MYGQKGKTKNLVQIQFEKKKKKVKGFYWQL